MTRIQLCAVSVFVSLIAIFLLNLNCNLSGNKQNEFSLIETKISDIHQAMLSGKITSRELVESYLRRIEAYDQSTKLNAIVVINPNALTRADELDVEFKRTGKLRPLHGIPIIVKDNYDTKDLQTAAGSLALKGSIPPDDAYQVRVLREAGAIVLVKSNMAEWAFSPYQTESSIAGTTLNPYDLGRVPAGSSGGTAAAVAANFGAVGLGTDTGNSIRGPSSHTSLVGIRSTIGVTSRDGIVPLYLRNDIGGPMARTVEDAVRVFDVIAGYDPADAITETCVDKIPDNYSQFLEKNGLQGARIGVLRAFFEKETTDPQVKELMEKAIEDIKQLGATIVDPFSIPNFDDHYKGIWCDVFRHDINEYFASLGENAPVKSLTKVFESGKYSAYIENRLKSALKIDVPPEGQAPPCLDVNSDPRRIAFREEVLKAMDDAKLDAVIYPSWSNPPRKVGDLESPHGNNSPFIPPHTGQPAITVPMGYTYENLPAGLQFLGRPFGEPELIKFAYAYEQATRHRRPPEKFPALSE